MVDSTQEIESNSHDLPQILKDTTCESTPPEMVQSAKQDHDELQRKGSIHLFLGPVYSEKTARLLAEITHYSSCGSIPNKCVLVANQKAFLDINLIPSSNETLECLELQEKLDTLKQYDVIAINEGQLFSDIVEICEQLANEGKIILVAAWEGTFQKEPLDVLKLVSKAEEVTKLTSKCHFCGEKASFSVRSTTDSPIAVLGSHSYRAACRTYYMLENSQEKF